MTWGVTPEGFNAKTLDNVKTETEDDLRAAFGQSIDLSPQSVFGQFVGIMSDRIAELWDVGQTIYTSGDPDDASDDALDNICAFTGTLREDARASTVVATCTGTPNTVLAVGRVVSVASVGTKFQTDYQATIAAVSAWAPSTTYNIGDRVTNTSRVYHCIDGGLSAGSGGPSGTGSAIIDNGCIWLYLGAGTGAIDVDTTAQVEGPFIALAGSLTVIETPVSGWSSVTNILDADEGANVEEDPELRLRREAELVGDSEATLKAIRANVLKVGEGTNNPVTNAYVFQNTTMMTDVNGLPPKSVEVLVQGGNHQDILQAVFDSVAGGIETYGNQSGTVVDDGGVTQTVKYSRPVDKLVYVVVNVVVDMSVFPVDGADQIKTNIVEQGQKYQVGKDVTASAVGSFCWYTIDENQKRIPIPGVLELTNLAPYIGTAPAPATTATIVCGNHDLAKFDSGRITVNVSAGTP